MSGDGAEQVYLDIAFVRIQRYIARTAKLRGRRAASAGMAAATDGEAIAARLPQGLAAANDEAGQTDGVVHLRLLDPRREGREERVRQVVSGVLAELRAEFPAAEFQAVWGAGESYVNAYADEIGPRMRSGDTRYVSYDLPVLPEFPAARLCPICSMDPATENARLPEAPDHLELVCADCAQRLRRRAQSVAQGGKQSAEQRLQKDCGLAEAPDALENLAPLGAVDTKRNHLATVYIDGNAVGMFFKRLLAEAASRPTLRDRKKNLSARLTECTLSALEAGMWRVLDVIGLEKATQVPVVPHVVGGDDVLVSVPASYAWPFVVGYMEAFDELVRNELAGDDIADSRLDLILPSASAGVVFARHGDPMYLLVDLAEEQLRAAKRATGGRASSVSFLDLTTEGPLGADDPPLPMSVLSADATLDALDRLSRLPRSQRARLAESVRQQEGGVVAEAQALRVGSFPAVEPFLPGPGGRPPSSGIALRHALRLVSWWRPLGPRARSGL